MAVRFQEINRINVNDSRDIVVSKVIDGSTFKGWNINNYLRTDGYTGFAKGGVFVPDTLIKEFGDAVKEALGND